MKITKEDIVMVIAMVFASLFAGGMCIGLMLPETSTMVMPCAMISVVGFIGVIFTFAIGTLVLSLMNKE